MSPRRSTATALTLLACGAAVLLTVPACSVTVPGQAGPTSSKSLSSSTQEKPMSNPLSGRPLSADAVATYTRMQEELRVAITAAVPTLVWSPVKEELSAGCGGALSGHNGRTVLMQPWATQVGVSAEQWPSVVAAMAPVAAGYEFTGPPAAAGGGREYRHEFRGPYGALLELSSYKAMVMMVQTGCHPES